MVPKFGDRLIVIIEQGGIAERAFNAINRTINNITINNSIFLLQTELL